MVAVSDYRALISGYSWNSADILATPIVLTYSFSQSSPYYMDSERPNYVSTFSPLTDLEKSIVKEALAAWSSVAGITFIETTKKLGDVNFSFVGMDAVGVGSAAAAGLGQYPGTFTYKDSNGKISAYSGEYRASGDVWFGTDYRENPLFSTDLISVALHEIGHALGLKHPHDIVGTHDHVLSPDPDGATVMSYAYRPTTLGPIDIAAAQHLYGAAGAASNWQWDAGKERFTFTGTAAGEVLRGTSLDDIIYANGGADIVNASMGNDLVYIGSQASTVKGGDGVDIAHTQIQLNRVSDASGTIDWMSVYTSGFFQTFESVEYIHFANGLLDASRKVFVSKEIFDQFATAHRQLVRVEAGHAVIEQASLAGGAASAFVGRLLASEARDTTIPVLVAFEAMLDTKPDAAGLDGLAAFVHNQIFSAGYQATPNPRLGGYEALGLALAGASPVVTAGKGKTDIDFVGKSYADIFGRSATATQNTHFVGQVDYFEALYRGVGISEGDAATKGRGAAYGQMLGYAVNEAGNPFMADAQQTLLGFLKAAGGGDWLV